jgi:hypothetical protein
MRSLIGLIVLLAPLAFGAGKGETLRIVIKGEALATPIVLSDPAVVSRFNVGTGPGANLGDRPGLIIDWPKGVADPPKGLRMFEVSFVTARTAPSTYIVQYGIDPATKRSYVFLPADCDAPYRDNVHLIYHGVEGSWYHTWSEWEKVARPLLEKALQPR